MKGKNFIHYKFRNDLDSRIVSIESNQIKIFDLKDKLYGLSKLSKDRWELKIWDAGFKREYDDDEIIPSQVMVVLQRWPRENAPKIQKTSRVESFSEEKLRRPTYTPRPLIPAEKWSKMTELERLEEIKLQSSEKYSAKYYLHGRDLVPFMRKPTKALVDLPPLGYICRICNKTDHFIKACPLKNFKRATGILTSELIPCAQDDPLAMITNGGRFVKRKFDQDCLDRAKAARKRALEAHDGPIVAKRIRC
ncbi:hypothetical protein QR680_007445 [Steinernema hermaphroditum]|uniref:DWNN domain-containing protein n=1 Tax=Steinernema hermaphroditum TaxID=289476 RepID=A0AA39ID67_9BILA|nr:hypothetical protein QR680_007445 [Steinernema hermaphroditum]